MNDRTGKLRLKVLSSAVLALATTVGCALPPELGFASRSDNLLHSMLQGETAPAEGSPAAVAKDVSPYPTALKPQTAHTPTPLPLPLPLQQSATPLARPLDPQQLAGRLPVRIPEPGTIPNAPPREEQRATYSPITENPWHPGAVATVTLEPAAPAKTEWPTASPLESAPPLEVWNQYVVGPRPNPLPQPQSSFHPPVSAQPANPTPSPAPEIQLVTNHSEPPPPAFVPPTFVPPEAPSPSDQPAREKPAPEPIDQLCERLILSLEEEIRQKTERKETEELPALKQKLRLLQLIADRTDDAVDQVEQLPPAEREAFKQLMFALTTWLSPDDSKRSSLRNAKILRSLQEVNNRLSAVSKLDLHNLMFCEKVESFGWFTEFPRAEFTPKQQVILYVEVQNFAAEEKNASAFETEMQGSYQIYDTSGNIIDEHQLPLDREVCRNYRRDYFLAYRVHLPADIAPGRYRLELTIEDLKAKKDFKGRKQGEAMIEFAIK